jgi:hypothetical protein
MDKAMEKKGKEHQVLGMNSSYSIFNSFETLHFVELAATSGVWLGDEDSSKNETISTLVAQEKAHAMLIEARVRKEKEELEKMQKEKQLIIREGHGDGKEEGDCCQEGDEGLSSVSPGIEMQLKKVVRKRRVGRGDFDTKIKILCWNIRGLGGKGRRKQLKELMYKYKVDVICLQETMKEHFTLSELRGLVGNNVLDGTGQLHKGIQGGGDSAGSQTRGFGYCRNG